MILIDLAPSINAITGSRDKKSASVWQADGLNIFFSDLTPTKNQQFYHKRSASVRQADGSTNSTCLNPEKKKIYISRKKKKKICISSFNSESASLQASWHHKYP